MAHEIVMPQLSLSMDNGQIVSWLKHNGDKITSGDILLEVESDKATVEVEAVESGILQIVLGPTDGEIPVGAVIGYTLAENEQAVEKASPAAPVSTGAVPLAAPEDKSAPAVMENDHQQQFRRLPSSPLARRKAAELKIDWQQATGTGRGGRIKERDVLRFSQQQAQVVPAPVQTAAAALPLELTPLAQRIANDYGLETALLAKLMPGKTRIDRQDVEQALRQLVKERQSAPASLNVEPHLAPALPAAPRREPMGAVRKRIAERMMLSEQSFAPVTLTTEVDATELVHVREALKNDPHTSEVPSYNVLFTRIASKALAEYPDLNSSLDGNEIIHWPTVNIGVAVDTNRGLVVPVVHDVTARSTSNLTHEMNDLLGRAAQGKALPAELTGGTFTITNLGVQEIDAFTPIINPPECAVLGIGRLHKQMVVVDDQPAVRTMLVLSLTFDHRLVDGSPAARFLQRIKQLCEQPYLWLS
ncbi:MAG: dihydrolipoamide acetyltransferase family protein [Anaerolineaceae bacterium]|nr:dihydrolipoamide acetyltransferase family protein [Anaerolineaceae bacterium]